MTVTDAISPVVTSTTLPTQGSTSTAVFDRFNITVRSHAYGVWMTGFIVCGATVAWRAMFAWLTHDRAEGDETIGVHTGLRRAA